MASPKYRESILDTLQDAVIEFDQELACETARRALSGGVDALDAVLNGLAVGVERAGALYARGEYFLPELEMCAEAFYSGLEILRPHVIRSAGRQSRGTVVIGTVQGDRHDIGKNLVKLMLEAADFDVCDLGVNVCPETFVEESICRDAGIVWLSATLTTGLSNLPRLIDMLRVSHPRTRIVVGGSAVSEQDACRWGADAYAPDAISVWRVVMRMMDLPLRLDQAVEAIA